MLSKLVRSSSQRAVHPHIWSQGSAADCRQQRNAPSEATASVAQFDESAAFFSQRLEQAEQDARRRVADARDKGYKEGLTAGQNQAAMQVNPVLEKLARGIQELAAMKPKLREEAEADVVKLAMAIARRVVHRELSIDGDSILGLVKVALGKIRLQEATRVRVHPSHLAPVKDLLMRSPGAGHIEVKGSPAAVLGDVVFETARGEFDASADLQLDEIDKGLTDRIGGQ